MKYNLTAAVIGTGFMGKTHLPILKELVERLVICAADEETGRALAEEYGCKWYADYNEMLANEQLDFVSVCVPTRLHYDMTMQALARGVHVLCEKPFASSAEEAAQMRNFAEEQGLTLMVGHCTRFSKQFEYIRRCIADERFGKVRTIHSFREDGVPTWSVGNWLRNAALSGGVARDLHIHDTDMIVGWLGKPKGVFTVGDDMQCRTLYQYGGKVITASASWRSIANIPQDRGLDVVFEKAWFKCRDEESIVYVDNSSFDPFEKEEFSSYFGDDVYENELRYFCDCLANGEKPELCLPSDSLMTMQVNDAELQSLQSGQVVCIE